MSRRGIEEISDKQLLSIDTSLDRYIMRSIISAAYAAACLLNNRIVQECRRS